jgi:VIT1/CCC1 family predicted Fe2+/Mn2+ transporter
VSLALSGAVLVGIGAAITCSPGARRSSRELVIGFAAAVVTYGIGALIGTAV